ncbi:hypothetical protein F442_21489 [Phytophthora nicotianae P10297]|uniref:RxLR effector protein n=3 Tax=Phytophthora nicotianae TaxID=4792 RepID=W2QT56_PHYN3|nr:hypothetical protein PPTG_06365 [Phytophthora nicotianae INRA-310]ETK71771.1 hypothetical protein L915_21038 [Phytophthora nicotianae]ETM31702.1 hypothetical protein L914_20782 [Phytophthora nicotianae]ETN16161.1 hypothetical protein PPTG_06365 [Phytophthora nicotianae INRA-310]ETP29352.1 hypothetical protein F442_21489 [Phytophthora nicotianae P10297]
MKTTQIVAVLSCVALALAPASIDAVRSLRAEDVMTPSPLDAFKVAIAKFEKKPASRRLNSDEDEKEVIKKFTKAMEKMKKNGRA